MMAATIYLYGRGDTTENGPQNNCYLKCIIPEPYDEDKLKNGFLPSVLHSYIMYAKDIGLIVSDVVYENFSLATASIESQLTYSLWPLFYVNNSNAFTKGNRSGIAVWSRQNFDLTYDCSVVLDETLAFYYKNKYITPPKKPNLDLATEAGNPIPRPNNTVNAIGAWYLNLTVPERLDEQPPASSYSIVQHYNKYVIWDTIVDMSEKVRQNSRYNTGVYKGTKQATGATLKAVVDNKYAYDALMPAWSTRWGEKPDWYDNERSDINDYNISASFFVYSLGKDPDSTSTDLTLFCTASNIKGIIKSGHAETRLLLSLDVLNYERNQNDWFYDVAQYYRFPYELVNIDDIIQFYKNKHIALISSLKPCYLCVGEVDASSDGHILTIDQKCVDMWASYENAPLVKAVKNVIYFDIDRPIIYPSNIAISIYEDRHLVFEWNLSLANWNEWSAMLYRLANTTIAFNNPIGPRIVEPAGECLKTGYTFTRYQNSIDLLLTPTREYIGKLEFLTRGYETEDVEDFR